jgi:23S rRNA (pseudouridine1915-N3)-methyltransferase
VKLRIVALGHRMPAWVAAGYAEYAKRLPRDYAVELAEIKPAPRSAARSTAQLLAAEALRIRSACAGFTVVAMDERGDAWTTRQLAVRLQRWRDAAPRPGARHSGRAALPRGQRARRPPLSP